VPRTKTRDFLTAAAHPAVRLEIAGFDDGRFCLMAHRDGETFIHANLDGDIKLYPRVEDILAWLVRHTGRTEATISIKNWRPASHRRRG
jgi:hypothetical protein